MILLLGMAVGFAAGYWLSWLCWERMAIGPVGQITLHRTDATDELGATVERPGRRERRG
jgi:hypothetical protein